mmetsp:Transcript_4290/g.11125  ORF Transcript_4290/g.11125 Transcript_4290/m.11125 type:complete len:135 (+) Transcript_4290:119-523(+)
MPKKDKQPDNSAELQGISWFYVKHGSAQRTLFNADCWAGTLLDAVKSRCGVEKGAICDLQDGESGTLAGLPKLEPRADASAVLRPTKDYVLVKPIYSTEGPNEGAVTGIETLYEPPEGENLPPPPPAPDAKKKK